MHDALNSTIERIAPSVTALRHELHEHPEIRYEEKWTSDRIAAFLDAIEVPYERGYAKGTGIVATLKGNGGRTVALRADIDALEIHEETGLPYASKIPNRMHACGHDGHTAILCGVAQALKAHEHDLPGTVRLLFQPAEELGAGGKYMVDDGAVEGVDAVFGLHGWPTLPLGVVGVRDGCMMASAQDFHVTVRGKGCHGADPGAGIDPIVVAAHITTALQSIVSREVDPWDAAVVTVGEIHGGTVTNIIPDTAVLRGTFRSLNESTAETLRRGIARIAEHTALAHRASADVTFTEVTYPPVVNDARMTDIVRATVRETLGDSGVEEIPQPYMGAEDFSYYQREVPGSYFWLGVNPHPDRPYPFLHNARYDFTDAALPIGMRLMAGVALRFLEQGAVSGAAASHA
jgi:hippurate hydrolase